MPLIKLLATIATCDYCTTSTSHIASTASPLAIEELTRAGWLITVGTTACPRCAPLVRLSIESGLGQSKKVPV